jgi:regulator of sigma E protease
MSLRWRKTAEQEYPKQFILWLLSINLALLNVLPIPMLDGGHLLFFSGSGLANRSR